jgi:hypothetical protein
MRIVAAVILSVISISSAVASEIREFDIPTLERLGNELSHRDDIASRAADLTAERYPEWTKVTPQWWISDLRTDADTVYLIAGTKSGPAPAYKVLFPKDGSPAVQDIHGQSLSPEIALRYKALQTGIKAVKGKLFDVPGYNFEILNDPDGRGFLVYALAVTNKSDEQIIGGHYRITVSADGSKAERIDSLSSGPMKSKADPGHKAVGIGAMQLVSKIPVETFIYSSYLYKMPIGVATDEKTVWTVVNGKITKMDPNIVKEAEVESKKHSKK